MLAARPALARPRRDHDHDRARAALERGEALPLAEVLARVRPELGGEVVGVDFDRDDGRWIYEFKVIGPAGRLVEVHVDAATARVLRRRAD
ncbi:peptidase M4 [Roseomonas soli]|uniref:Peptidase M4 n=1 Tax=Neoroseomonas soli TaxID=1081025 RepID=A0A9X9X110_9PROT|nr:peptidase M4 [Neoroseomonas soli]